MTDDDRFTRITLRIPKDLHAKLAAEADSKSHSMNAEIVQRLRDTFGELAGASEDNMNLDSYTYIDIGIQKDEAAIIEQMRREKDRIIKLENVLIEMKKKHPKPTLSQRIQMSNIKGQISLSRSTLDIINIVLAPDLTKPPDSGSQPKPGGL